MDKIVKNYLVVGIRFVVKYVIPLVLGWLEGDTHTIQDFVLNLSSVI